MKGHTLEIKIIAYYVHIKFFIATMVRISYIMKGRWWKIRVLRQGTTQVMSLVCSGMNRNGSSVTPLHYIPFSFVALLDNELQHGTTIFAHFEKCSTNSLRGITASIPIYSLKPFISNRCITIYNSWSFFTTEL